MIFNRSIIFITAWAKAREINANYARNQHVYGTPRSLRSCFAQALREAWYDARCAAIAARHVDRTRAYTAFLSPYVRAIRLEAARERLALLAYSNAAADVRTACQAHLQSEIEALATAV